MANQDFKTTGGIQAQSATISSSLTLGSNASYSTSRTITLDAIVVIDPIDGVSYASQDNGVTFKQHQLPSDNYSNIINDGTKFYAMGDQGNFASSVDGYTWVSVQNDYNGGRLLKLAKSGSRFVAIANNGDTLHSPNGSSWIKTAAATSGIITSGGNVFIAGSPSQFVVVESGSTTYWYSSNGTTWTSGTLPQSGNIVQLSYGNGNFLIAETTNTLLTSTDGLNWSTQAFSFNDIVTDIQYLNGYYIGVAHGSITFSTDLTNWTTTSNLFDGTNAKYIAYTNNQYFVAEENTLALYTSTDLINWNAGQIVNPNNVDNGNIVAISGLHINTTVTSTVAPTAFSSLGNLRGDIQDQLDSKSPILSPIFKGNVVLPQTTVIGNTTSTELGYLHGVTSSIQTQLNSKLSSSALSSYATLANPTFTGTVTVPDLGVNGIVVSETEISYLHGLTGNIQAQLNAAGNGSGGGGGGGSTTTTQLRIKKPLYLAFVNGYNMQSTDLTTWTAFTNSLQNMTQIFVANGKLYATVGVDRNLIYSSSDGVTWDGSYATPQVNSSVVYVGELFFGLEAYQSQNISVSTDAITWHEKYINDGWYMNWGNMYFDGTTYIGVGQDDDSGYGKIIYSPDNGNNWLTANNLPYQDTNARFEDIIMANGIYVLLSDTYNGQTQTLNITSSTSLTDWSDSSTYTANESVSAYWRSVAYGNGTFVAVGYSEDPNLQPAEQTNDVVYSSTDGMNWTKQSTPSIRGNGYKEQFYKVSFIGGQFVAQSAVSRNICTSTDGVTWVTQQIGDNSEMDAYPAQIVSFKSFQPKSGYLNPATELSQLFGGI